HVLMTCPDDQGCANGTCEPACKAASDSHGTLGCDFVVSTPHLPYKTPPCFSAVLSNTWPKPVHVTVTRTGAGVLDPTTFIRLPTSDPDTTHWPLLTGAGVGTDQSAIVFLAGDPTSGSEY